MERALRIGSCALAVTVGLAVQRADAGHLWDCLFGKPDAGCTDCRKPCGPNGAAPAAGAPATAQPYMVPIGPPRLVPGTPGAAPGPANSAPSLAPTGASISGPSQVVSRPTTPVQFAPYTAYHNQVNQVPVTVYRPITAIDPRTGSPVTVLQPCQTSVQQVQRLPNLGSRSFARAYRPIPVQYSGVPAQPMPVAMAPAYFAATRPAPVVQDTQVAPAATWIRETQVPTQAPNRASPTLGVPSSVEPADLAPTLNSSGVSAGASRPPTSGGFRPSFPSPARRSSPSNSIAGSSDPQATTGNRALESPANGDDKLQRIELPPPPDIQPIPLPEAELDSEGLKNRIPSLLRPVTEDRSANITPRGSNDGLATHRLSDYRPTNLRSTNPTSTTPLDDSRWRSLAH